MHIRKFYANNLPAAIRDIRKTLGADAVILSTRYLTTLDKEVIVNGGRAKVEVTAVREKSGGHRGGAIPRAEEKIESLRPRRSIQPQIPECLPNNGSLRNNLLRSASAALSARNRLEKEKTALKQTEPDEARNSGIQASKSVLAGATAASAMKAGSSGPAAELSKSRAAKPEALQTILRELKDLRSKLDSMDRSPGAAADFSPASRAMPPTAAQTLVAKPVMDRLAPMPVDDPVTESLDEAMPNQPGLPRQTAAVKKPSPVPIMRIDSAPAIPEADKAEEKLAGLAVPGASGKKQTGDSAGKQRLVVPLRKFQEHLYKQGVDPVLVRRILDRMRFSYRSDSNRVSESLRKSSGGGRTYGKINARGVFDLFVESVRDFVPVPGENQIPETRGRAVRNSDGTVGSLPRKIALVGPTGVGKTTTLAKIASYYALEKNLRVGLVTLDTYRIGAVEQLRTYAKLLGIPIEVIADPPKLEEAFERFSNTDLVLVDTPGHSPGDSTALERLAASLNRYEDLELHLVVTASLRAEETRRIMESFQPMDYDRLIFSKMDEARRLGEILNTWIMGGVDVSYFTTGQRVPEDLEAASVDSLCKHLVIR